jgi:hypothetical protein
MTKAIVVALIQSMLLCSLGARFLYDRTTLPRAWFKAGSIYPDLASRGRYLPLQLQVNDALPQEEVERVMSRMPCGSIDASSGKPVAVFDQTDLPDGCANLNFALQTTVNGTILWLPERVFVFIPANAQYVTQLEKNGELWLLATIPRKGPPRPIALGIKKAGGTEIQRIDLH